VPAVLPEREARSLGLTASRKGGFFMIKKTRILAVGAHPDDIEFYAAGTLLQLSAKGEIYFVVATDGRNGYHHYHWKKSLVKTRRAEQLDAADLIKVKKVFFLNFTDGELENNTQKLKLKLRGIFSRVRPEVVFSFDPHRQHVVHDDYHPDHRTLAHAVLDVALIDATLPAKVRDPIRRPKIYLYNPEKANLKINIGKIAAQKKAVLEKFKSQELKLTGSLFKFEKFKVY
jgi:LmbE family N-acetylglucosaminyl deacetylase